MFLLTSIAWPYRGLRYRPTEFECFFEGIRWQVDTFQMIAGSSSIFLKCIWNKSCSWAALLKCWFRTDFGRENSTGFYITCKEGNRFWLFSLSRVDHALRPLLMFWLVKIWQVSSRGKFMQRLETCLLIAGADRVLSGSFVSSCDVLNWLFLLGVQNEIQLLSRLFCNSWLVCLLRFLFTNAPPVKVIGNPISDGIVFKNELTHLPLLEA